MVVGFITTYAINAYCCIEYTLPSTGLELKTLVVIGIDCIGSYKSNYHTITITPPEIGMGTSVNIKNSPTLPF
jgi:hypothetical protein